MTIRVSRSVRPPLRTAISLQIIFVLVAMSSAWVPRVALATTFIVNDNGDTGDFNPGDNVCETASGNGVCTLRAAIQEANAHAGTDAITVNPLTITLGGSEIDITAAETLTITGTGGAASSIVDGALTSRVLGIARGATVTINGLTIQNGKRVGPNASGGCISTAGTLTMNDSVITGCESSAGGGAIYNASTLNLVRTVVSNSKSAQVGGALMNDASGGPAPINLTDCTVKDNQAAGAGGGIFNGGDTVTLVNTTLSGNQSSSIGGAIDNNNFGTLTLTNCTVSGNTAASSGGAINGSNTNTINLRNVTITKNTGGASAGETGGVISQDTIHARNTVIADNTTLSGNQPDCSGTLASEGYNLIGDTTGCTITGDTTGNITGVLAANLHLGPLADNGGLTQTHALLPGSPAIDAGNPAAPGSGGVACEATDQRGVARPFGPRCDIGAFEGGSPPPCPPTPLAGCRTPTQSGKAVLVLKQKPTPAKDVVVWKWVPGAATILPELGDPLAATEYHLCLYDESTLAQPLLFAVAPPGGTCAGKPCWKATKTGFKYKDKDLTPDGLLVAVLKSGAAGKAKIVVKGKGANLHFPSLPLTTPVRVQLSRNDGGPCWDAVYGTPSRNDATQFKAKSE